MTEDDIDIEMMAIGTMSMAQIMMYVVNHRPCTFLAVVVEDIKNDDNEMITCYGCDNTMVTSPTSAATDLLEYAATMDDLDIGQYDHEDDDEEDDTEGDEWKSPN